MSHTKSSRHLSAHKYLALMRTIRFNASQHRFNRCWTHALWNWVFWLAENGFPNFEIICISGQAQVCLVVYSLDYHRVKIFIPHVFRNGVLCARWMRQKGHCFAKTLKQSLPRLGLSSSLCAALRLHANASVFCSDFFGTVLQMVRLFLFRLGSLLGLFGLLVWEAFYRPNGDNFAGKQSRKTKIFSHYHVWTS